MAVSGVRVREAAPSSHPDDVVLLRVEAPVCKCHGLPQYRNGHRKTGGTQKWVCRVQRLARTAADYERIKADPVKMAARRAAQRERWPDRIADPVYRLERSLNELARVRVR